MLQYKAGYKYVGNQVHAQVLDFPAAITCAETLEETRRALKIALVDVAEAAMETGQALPVPDPLITDTDMDVEEPIFLHLQASSGVEQVPSGVVAP
jgi:predicted RNase H-like HicB family nuclease